MPKVTKHGVLLEPTGLSFENDAVLNPSCIQDGNTIHMFYRAVKKGNFSSIGYCKLKGPLNVVERSKKPVLVPSLPFEKHGVEDPRVVKLNGTYFMFYSAFDGKNCVVAYATSKNMKKWKKMGIISPRISYDETGDIIRKEPLTLKCNYLFFDEKLEESAGKDVLVWEKDGFIFPKKINGKIAFVHRILPEIQVAYVKSLKDLNEKYWRVYLQNLRKFILLGPVYKFESRNVGGGVPPIETKDGWLFIFHAVENAENGKIYHASAALVDKNDPTKLIGRLKKPLFSPQMDYEKKGDVNNVVFPTGTSIFGDKLYIYYGAADKRIAVASVTLSELLKELRQKNPIKHTSRRIFEECTDIGEWLPKGTK